MAASAVLDVDAATFADWLVSKGEDRLWTVDGEARLAGLLSFPCTARQLADGLRGKHAERRLRLFTPTGKTPDVAEIEKYADTEDGAQVFEVAWLQDDVPADHWLIIAEDELAEAAERIAVEHP
jgi:hypothetical protein